MNAVPPTTTGWYITEGKDTDAQMQRFWNGVSWSAPCYSDDPIPLKLRMTQTPAENSSGVTWLSYCPPWVANPTLKDQALADAVKVKPVTAVDVLDRAAQHMRDRAAAYDKPEGERSMAATVKAFNSVTGGRLTESEGWLFMSLLKMVRDRTAPGGHEDSQEDCAAYVGLMAEARRAGV